MADWKTARRRVVLLLLAGLAACTPDDREPAPANSQAPAPPAPPAREPPAPLALSRADLIVAAAQAASTYAAGTEPPAADPLVDRTFRVQLPFGCDGPTPLAEAAVTAGLAQWRPGLEGKTITLDLTPADWTGSAWLGGGEGGQWEAIEGYWLARPWLVPDGCPKLRADPLATGPRTPAAQTLGLAAVYEAGGSRVGRRKGRAYSFVIRGTDGTPVVAPAGGYRLRLEGRIGTFAGGRAVRCRADGLDQRPVCVVAIRLDRVAFEDAEGNVLSDWRTG